MLTNPLNFGYIPGQCLMFNEVNTGNELILFLFFGLGKALHYLFLVFPQFIFVL